MLVRAPEPEDAADIAAIARANDLPLEWCWPDGHHGLVAEYAGRVVAFCILQETVYGLVVEELWEEDGRVGRLGLGALARNIEEVAQRLADERGKPLEVGGIVRLTKERHIAALRKRGYTDVATILAKNFLPQALPRDIGRAI